MRYFKTPAIIYKVKQNPGADKIVWMLTRDYGKITAIAKGVGKINSRRNSHIDIFNHNNVVIVKGKSLDVLSETSSINNFSQIKSTRVYEIFYLAELLDKITVDESESRYIYDMLIEIFEIANNENFGKLLSYFEINLLSMLGFHPNLESYLDNDVQFSQESNLFLSHQSAGFESHGEKNLEVDHKIVKCLRFFLNNNLGNSVKLNIDGELQSEISRVNRTWICSMFDIKFKSLEFLKDK